MNNTMLFCYISLNQIHYSLKKGANVEKSANKNPEFIFKTGYFIVYICSSFFSKNDYKF